VRWLVEETHCPRAFVRPRVPRGLGPWSSKLASKKKYTFVQRGTHKGTGGLAGVRHRDWEGFDRSPRIRLEVEQDIDDAIPLAASVGNRVQDNEQVDVRFLVRLTPHL
jgi:hypothetical protein